MPRSKKSRRRRRPKSEGNPSSNAFCTNGDSDSESTKSKCCSDINGSNTMHFTVNKGEILAMPRAKKSGGGVRPKSKENLSSNSFWSNEDSDSESAKSKFCSDINGSNTMHLRVNKGEILNMPQAKKSGGGIRPKSKEILSSNSFWSNEDSDSESAKSKFCSDINGSNTMHLRVNKGEILDMPRAKKSGGGVRLKSKENLSSNSFWLNGDSDSESAESKFCSDVNETIQTYESVMKEFQRAYLQWRKKRQDTLSKLKELVADVHNDQLAFNRNGLLFKEANMTSRELKNIDIPLGDFFASMAIFITDAVDSVNSIAQACNVDKYMKTFGEIMESDAEITKPLHKIRSKCFSQYHNVEEIIRRYHSETFRSTMDKISQSLITEDMWLEVKSSSKGDNVSQVIATVDGFFQQVSKSEVQNEIGKSVGSYVDSNPAVLEACESAGKALYGIYDTWGRNRFAERKGAITSVISSGVNGALMMRERREIMRLQSLTQDEEMSQAKLESKIHEAIDDLEQENLEMKILYDRSSAHLSHGRGYNHHIFN